MLMHSLNDNLFCAIDTESAGTVAGYHDLLQVAFLPLEIDLEFHRKYPPFVMDIRPQRPENNDPKAMDLHKDRYTEICLNGMDFYDAAERFVEWFEGLKVGFNKRIIPLGCNWPHDRGFIQHWLGQKSYDLYIDARYRDLMSAASFLNDEACWFGNPCPYSKVNLSYFCAKFNIDRSNAHDASDDARVTAIAYKHMMQRSILPPDFSKCRETNQQESAAVSQESK